jgi:hypothetical protein
LAGEVEVEEEEDEEREDEEKVFCLRGAPQASIGDYGSSASRWRSASIAERKQDAAASALEDSFARIRARKATSRGDSLRRASSEMRGGRLRPRGWGGELAEPASISVGGRSSSLRRKLMSTEAELV